MRRCKICQSSIEHLHGNRKICYACEANEIKHNPVIRTIDLKPDDFARLTSQASLGSKIEQLPEDARKIVYSILERFEVIE